MPAARDTWELTEHCCRVCFGRVLKATQATEVGVHRYRCSNCALEGLGRHERAICACGLKTKRGQDLGVRCIRNPEPTPEQPCEIIADGGGVA